MRGDNADQRLTPIGYKAGLIKEERYQRLLTKMKNIEKEVQRLKARRVKNDEAASLSEKLETRISPGLSYYDLLKRPEMTFEKLRAHDPDAPSVIPGPLFEDGALTTDEAEQVEIQVKYEGYIWRQEEQIEKFRKMEEILIPDDMDYAALKCLRSESMEKLTRIKPRSIGQASRISGITPSDVSLILIYLKKISSPI
jgi:tRNA uridine 5-carboxymethylaminomethyl modification enzyme